MREVKGKRFKPVTSDPVIHPGQTRRAPRFKTSDETVQKRTFNSMTENAQDIGKVQTPIIPQVQATQVSVQNTASFQTLKEGQGAVVQTKENAASTTGALNLEHVRLPASHKPQISKNSERNRSNLRNKVSLYAALACVLLGLGFWFYNSSKGLNIPVQDTQSSAQYLSGDEVELNDNIFSIVKNNQGIFTLMSKPVRSSQGEVREYCKFEGEPVKLLLYKDSFIIGENLANSSWDVVIYNPSSGSIVTKLTDKDGNALQGSGLITSIEIQGDELKVVLSDGSTKTQSLVE